MPEGKIVSPAVIRRLPRYYRYLGELLAEGITRISSKELSERMKVTASQIRQDLNCFGGFGQQGYGYAVHQLRTEIGSILGIDRSHKCILIGAGNLGRALSGYDKFKKRGFIIKALFDSDPRVVGSNVNGFTVKSADEIEDFVKANNIDIGVITIPKSVAQDAADRLISAGIKGIWNFSHFEISVPDSVALENVHMSDSLMTLSCKISRAIKD